MLCLVTLAFGLIGIAYRVSHLASGALTEFDKIAIGLGAGLFCASVLDFWRAKIRRGLVVSSIRLALTFVVAIRFDIPLAQATLLRNYANMQMKFASSEQQKIRASFLVLTLVDGSPLVSLLAMEPQRLVDEGRCQLFLSEYRRHVPREFPTIRIYFSRHIAACQSQSSLQRRLGFKEISA